MLKILKKVYDNDYTLSIAVKLFCAAIGIVCSAFCTRYLGVKYKGDYNYISQVANILVLVLNMGIYQSYSYNYKKHGSSITQKYINICFCQFVLLLCISVILIMTTQDTMLSMIIILVPFNIIKLQYGNIVLIEKIKLNFALTVFNSVFLTISYALLYYYAETKILYVVVLTLVVDVITVICYICSLKIVPKFYEIDIAFLRSVIKFGFIPMLSVLLSTINYHIDIIFLKKIGAPEELSYYSLATNIINYVWMIPDAFKSVLFSKSGKKFDKENILFSSQISSLFIFTCFAGFTVFGRLLLGIIYGKEFINSYGVTVLLIIGAFSMSFYKLTGVVLVSEGRRIAHFVTLAISAIINVIFNLILIPGMGMYGAAIASVCSYTICGFGLLLYFCRIYNMNAFHLIFPSKDTIKSIVPRIIPHRHK